MTKFLMIMTVKDFKFDFLLNKKILEYLNIVKYDIDNL